MQQLVQRTNVVCRRRQLQLGEAHSGVRRNVAPLSPRPTLAIGVLPCAQRVGLDIDLRLDLMGNMIEVPFDHDATAIAVKFGVSGMTV